MIQTATASWTRRIGVALMAASLAIATVLATGGPVSAQEAEQLPEDAKEATVTKAGFYDAPLSDVIPPSVLESFPPQVLCLVVVKACTGDLHEDQPDQVNEGFDTVTGGVEEGTGTTQENDPNEPASPVPPESLPVSVTTGQDRYRSAVAFELPSVPSGHQVDSFKVYLSESQPTGGISSPALRQAVLAGLTCARTSDDSFVSNLEEETGQEVPEQFADLRSCQQSQFEKILTQDPIEQNPLGLEMCPIADNPSTEDKNAEWEGERSQDPDNIPETDCFLGANGKRLEDGTWEFDMTFALDAWSSGEIPNQGVLVVPQGAPNFAFGDPDSSFNKQVTFEQSVQYTIATSEEPDPVGFPSSDFGSTSSSSSGSSSFSAPSGGTSGNVESFSAPANEEPQSEPAPEVATNTGTEQQPNTEPVAAGPQEQPGAAWYTWLLAPVFLGGAYLTAQSLTAPAASALASGPKEGAMTRLLQQQGSSAASNGPQLA
ncbi:MAG: hypothetical protein R3343_12470 [Nitriliruptorales bacterium]|nr:hypothetical protein [Nitriliruptorales bacterium]